MATDTPAPQPLSLAVDRRRLLQAAGAATALTATGLPALAQSGLIPLADFLRDPAISQLRLSPDGRHIVGVRPGNGRLQLFVFDVAARRSLTITNFSDSDATSPTWVSNDRILFGVYDSKRGSGDQFSTGLFAIDRDAKDFLELSERSWLSTNSRLLPVSTFYHAKGVGSGPDEVLVEIWGASNGRLLTGCHIHRLNTRTGRATLITAGGPTRAQGWGFDRAGVARVALTSDDDGTYAMHYRASADAPWAVVHQHRFDDPNGITPIAFDGQDGMCVLARNGRDFLAVWGYDIAKRALSAEPIAALEGYDLTPEAPVGQPVRAGAPLVFDEQGRIIGVSYHAERRGTLWLEPTRQALQASLEATFPNRLVGFQGDPAKKDRPLLISVTSDVDAPAWFLFDQDKRQLASIGSSRPWLPRERMATVEVYRYAARDGLSIPATLTVPAGREKKDLPVVVLHYGGPWARAIQWGFDPFVQFLASRGYAVFMPAPRASVGFGWKHFRAGWKQWGLAMQDDVTDGVQDLIRRGIADPKRIALTGASYGGYLTMMGLVKDPELYRCGINWVGVTDPELMYVEWTDFALGNSREVSLPQMLGHPRTDAEQFARTSPVRRAAEIRRPVLMAYGGSDRRVPIINGERMRDALRRNPNVEVEWVVYPDEGHGFRRMDNQLDFWGRVERFLAKHMA